MEEPIRTSLKYVFDYYLRAKNEPLKNHKVAFYLTHQIPTNFLDSRIINSEKYVVSGSAGKGNWAEIPWISIFDRDISITATKGYYIVYLFRSDMKGVFLSLNQGWTYFKDKYKPKLGRKKIEQISTIWQNMLASDLGDFPQKSISLNASGELAHGYELGHIYGKYYSNDNLPSERILATDLQSMLAVFRELKGHFIRNSIEDTNNYLLVHYNDLLVSPEKKSKPELNNLIESNANKSILSLSEPPKSLREYNSQSVAQRRVSEQDYMERNQRQTDIGLAGELMVINLIKERLQKLGIDKQIIHISKKDDSAGYDIKSYDDNGEEKFIEVKTTMSDINTPFHISANEVSFSQTHAQQYRLIRIFNFDPKEKKASYYILDGDISKHVRLQPESYISQL